MKGKKMIGDLHATFEIDKRKPRISQPPEEWIKNHLAKNIGRLISENTEELPVTFTETESSWTPGTIKQLDVYVVSEKIYNILKHKITPDMLLRLENVNTTALMTFIAANDCTRL